MIVALVALAAFVSVHWSEERARAGLTRPDTRRQLFLFCMSSDRHRVETQISIGGWISLPGDKKGGRGGHACRSLGRSTLSFLVTHSLSQPASHSVRGPDREAGAGGKSITPACVVRSYALVTRVQKVD